MPTRRQFLLGCLGTGVAVATPVGWYGGVYEPNDIEVTHQALKIRNLPARLEGTSAIQISDLHLHESDGVHSRLIDLIKHENPHFVFFTGDLVNDATAMGHAVDLFRSLDPPGGIWAVLGNSDLSAGVADVITTRLAAAHVRYLIDQNAELESGLWIAGVNDPSSYLSDVGAAVDGIPAGAPKILLAHSPDIVDQLNGASFDLMLAGHTHGGQINLPLFSGAWLHDGPSRQYVSGLYSVAGSPLYVNRGIGMQRIPLRIGARPEITHITFYAA